MLFDLSLKEFDALTDGYVTKIKECTSKKEAKKLVKEAEKGALLEAYNALNEDLLSKNKIKLEQEDNRFDAEATKLFDEFVAKENEIEEFYNKNEDNVEQYIVERRRNNAHKENKAKYKKACKKLDDGSYMRRKWLKDDVTYLKNHYLNAVKTLKDLTVSERAKNFRLKFLDVVFGMFVNSRKLKKYSQRALSKIGVTDIYAGAPTCAYDIQARKLIEIAKCLNKNPEIFIVDETTTALSEIGRNLLYKKMEELKNNGKSVLFISHNLEELMEKCDTLTVLRDGNIVANLSKEKNEFDADAIKKYMIGRELKGDYYRSDYDGSYGEEVVLKMVDGIEGKSLKHINLELHKGEILGIGGLSDCGMHVLGKALFGNIKMEGGFVYAGKNLDVLVNSEVVAMKNKIGYLPKNRDIEALALKSSIYDNIAIASINNIAKANLLVFKGPEKKLVQQQVRDLQIKCNDAQQLVNTLSGGNKQKVSLAKWIANDSEILVLDCPTRGVDIGVKQFLYQLLYQMKKQGKSIIMISEELPELIGMSDRIVIMKDGEITKEFYRSPELNQEEIIKYMI